jgi:formate hydrogenlyase transcriptional activator
VILANDGVLPNSLPPPSTAVVSAPAAVSATTLKDSERSLILNTLELVGWKIGGPQGAAAKLGLHRTTLINRMKRLGISRPGRPVIDFESESDVAESSL